MNIQEIKEKISELTNEDNYIRLPFSLMVSALESTKRESNMDVHELDFATIFFYRVVNGVKAVLEHLEIEFDYPKTEDGSIDAYTTYDQFLEIYEILEYNTLFKYNDLLDSEIELAIKERISLGQFESKIINLLERATTQFEKLTDKKQLSGILKTIKKELTEFGELLKANKVDK